MSAATVILVCVSFCALVLAYWGWMIKALVKRDLKPEIKPKRKGFGFGGI